MWGQGSHCPCDVQYEGSQLEARVSQWCLKHYAGLGFSVAYEILSVSSTTVVSYCFLPTKSARKWKTLAQFLQTTSDTPRFPCALSTLPFAAGLLPVQKQLRF